MMGGVHLKRPDRFSSCASFDLYSIPYLIKQASLFHATGSRVLCEVVTVKTGKKPIQWPGNSSPMIAFSHCLSSTSSPWPSHFLKENPWGLGPRLCLTFLTTASTAYRKLNESVKSCEPKMKRAQRISPLLESFPSNISPLSFLTCKFFSWVWPLFRN